MTLAPGPRELTTVSVVLSSQACETGAGTPTCVTTPGATFDHPLTMTLYNVAGTPAAPTVGSVIATLTDTFTIPFRPSADPVNCTGANAGRWFDGSTCFNRPRRGRGLRVPGGHHPSGHAHLGHRLQHQRRAATHPIGAPGPYDSLNVGSFTVNPTVGTDVDEDMAFISDRTTGGFVSELGWTGNRPMARIETQVPPTVPEAPSNVTATPGDGQVTLSWTAPPDGGSPITGYVIGGGGTCTPTPATATSCVVTGLTNGVAVNFTVAAVNGVGTGPAATSPTVTPFAQPVPVPPAVADVVSLTPARLLDSRGPNSTVDGLGSWGWSDGGGFGHRGAGRGAGWCAGRRGGGGVERDGGGAGGGCVRDGVPVWSVGADGVEHQLSVGGRHRQRGDRAVGCGRQGVHLHVRGDPPARRRQRLRPRWFRVQHSHPGAVVGFSRSELHG